MDPLVYTPSKADGQFDIADPDTPIIPQGKEYKLKMVNMNGVDIAAFNIEGEDLLCFPQVYEYFLKDMVSGMHTVYTKLKRMNITGKNCNVEQVRMMRSVGAIGQVVNRCKLISHDEFNRLYEDCLLYRGPGRRKKNPNFPPELLNNPFKHFKFQRTPNGEPCTNDETKVKPLVAASKTRTSSTQGEESRDLNNNDANNDATFKSPLSPQHHEHASHHVQPVITPQYSVPHVISNPPRRMSHSPSATNVLNQTGNFAFPPRVHLPPNLQGASVGLRTSGTPPGTIVVIPTTHSPDRVSSADPHVSSTGNAEHVEYRRICNDTGSEVSECSPRVPLREVEYRDGSSTETLLLNIQGLLNVAAESCRQKERHAFYEKEELRSQLQRERDGREKSERQCAALQRNKAFLHKKIKREKKTKRKLSVRIDEDEQRMAFLEQQLKDSSHDGLKQLNESLMQELEKERLAKVEAERKLKEARGEIQNFVHNFLDNPGQEAPDKIPQVQGQGRQTPHEHCDSQERGIKEEHGASSN